MWWYEPSTRTIYYVFVYIYFESCPHRSYLSGLGGRCDGTFAVQIACRSHLSAVNTYTVGVTWAWSVPCRTETGIK